MERALVTGGAGFIGSAMAEKLALAGLEVVIVDNLVTGSENKIPKLNNIKFINCNVNKLSDISGVFYTYKFDYVFHYAALVGVQRTLNNPVKVLDDIKGIENLLTLSKNTGVKHVYYSSSSEVYGEPVEFPQNEHTTPLNSRLPYAIVKNVGEAYLKSYHKEFGLPYTIFRFFNTFGPKQSKDFVISKFLANAINGNDITVYGDGKQTRTFCYIDDNTDACYTAFAKKEFVNEVVNIGGNTEVEINDLAKTIIEVTGSSSKIKYLPPLNEGDMSRRLPDVSKMTHLLQRFPLTLREGLVKILENTEYIL